MPPGLIEKIDARAEGLGLNRSTYVQQLIRRDLENTGIFVEEQAALYTPPATSEPPTVREEDASTVSVKCTGYDGISAQSIQMLESGIEALLTDILEGSKRD